MKTVLVTGASGFIGSHLTEFLVEKGLNVRAFIHYNSRNTWGWLEKSTCVNNIEPFVGDIRDFDSVRAAVKGCDTVFHIAALIGIPYSYVSPIAYVRTNIEGTYNVLQTARDFEVENVIITSTSETYGTAQYVPIDENHPVVGQSPYSATKIGADQIALSFYKSFGLPVKIVRPFNTFGPRQSARAIIPTAITQILSGKHQINLGNLHPTRDFTFVKDTVNGFYAISQSEGLTGHITNIGMNKEISIKRLVDVISELIGEDVLISTDSQRIRPANSEVDRLFCDNSKLIQNTNWKPQYSLQRGLALTIEFFKRNLDIYKAEIYNV
jgi:NAD dependent epimerase/dehydratase